MLSHNKNKIIVGYYPIWAAENLLPCDKIDFTSITHISIAFYLPSKNNFYEIEQCIKKIIKVSLEKNVRILISIGGGNKRETFHLKQIIKNKFNRSNFIKKIMDFICKNLIDGIDIDWEYPESKIDSIKYIRFVKEFRIALDKIGKNKFGENYYLSIACPPIEHYGKWFDIKNMQKYIDKFHIMTYDYYTNYSLIAGHNSPLFYGNNGKSKDYFEWTIKYWLINKKMEKSKLLAGLPFYGRKFSNVKFPYDKNTPSKNENAIIFRDIILNYSNKEWVYFWDIKRQVPYKYNKLKKSIIFYDDEMSINKKCEYVIKNNLSGVIIWALGQDRINNKQQLLEVIKRKLK